MTEYKRIFIIGYPGSGKGLIAKKLAEQLGWRFIDADFGVEFNVGKTAAEIFGEEGFKHFLNCQTELLSTFLKQENIVVATDGTIACSDKNSTILASELSVYLKVSTATQLERVSRDSPPLLTLDTKALLDKLHHQRDGIFEEVATIAIDTEEKDVETHLRNIMKFISSGDSKKEESFIKLGPKDLHLFHRTSHHSINLTEQQGRCLKLLSQGKSSKEIAKLLTISYRTVEGMLAKLIEDTGCASSKELIVLYHDKP